MSSYHHFDTKVIKKRKKYRGKSPARFEVYVLKTNKHIVAVLYDKEQNRDVTSVSTRPHSFKKLENRLTDAFNIGTEFAKICKEKGIENLAFNKLNYKFHGIIAEVAKGIRENGINV